MRRLVSVVAAIAFAAAVTGSGMTQMTPAPSESSGSSGVLGSVTRGNTTVVFEAANPSDIDSSALTTWDGFAAEHPSIARALAYKPSLMNDPGYLNKHPELSTFFEAHPEVRDAMAANPGNFAAIPPRPGE